MAFLGIHLTCYSTNTVPERILGARSRAVKTV